MEKLPFALGRITDIEPLPAEVIARDFERTGKEWIEIEEVATRAQGPPDYND